MASLLPITALCELCNHFVLTMDLICRTSASASDSRKTDFDWSYHLSKTVEKGSSGYAGTSADVHSDVKG